MTITRRKLIAAFNTAAVWGIAAAALGRPGRPEASTPDAPVVTSAGPSRMLSAARGAGVTLSTSIRDTDRIWAEPFGDFLRANVDEYTSGTAFLPHHLCPSYGGAPQPGEAGAFMARARRDGKSVHIHCPIYALHIETKVAGAKDALTAGDLGTAKAFVRKILDTAAMALPADFSGTIDVVNEDVSGEFGNRGWIDHSISRPFGSLLAFWRFCFDETRRRWPKASLFVCMNNTEEVGNSGFHQMVRYQFLGYLKRAVADGIEIDGVTLQGHCIFRRGLVDGRFVDFLKAIRGLGLRLRIGELDARSSEDPGQFIDDYDDDRYTQLVARHHDALLMAALPYVTDGVTLWTLSDADNSWKRNLENTADSGERPCAFDADFQAKPQVLAAIIGAFEAREIATDFSLDPDRERVDNGRFKSDLRGFSIDQPEFDWIAGKARGTSTGTAARLSQVVEVEPGMVLKLNLNRPLDTTSLHVGVSQSLGTREYLSPPDVAYESEYPETSFIVPEECYALAILLTTGNTSAGSTAFVDDVSFRT